MSKSQIGRNFASLLVGVSLLTLTGCMLSQPQDTAQTTPETQTSPEAQTSPETAAPGTGAVANVATQNGSTYQPASRVMPITIEGQTVETQLNLFQSDSLPFTTYVPAKDFQTGVSGSNQGQEAQFYFSPTGTKDPKAYIQVFLPPSTSVEDLQQSLLSDQGIMATNQWELVDRTNVVSYPWATEKLIYQKQTPNGLEVGAIYLGEHQGNAFYVLTHYPAEYADGFEPRSAVILENLQFKE
ncbi:MAG: hypothetical protein MUF49_09915 [Oculatellaceae cyanobacterium Prado106]|jgi:hypothetical protein|nr:hypothetical protein [Oculatellaceae cyanobacterium Prado106]